MKQTMACWQAAGFLFAAIFGTFLHFLFDLTGHSRIVALFSAVNESIWEHMKLVYYPMFLFALVERRFAGKGCKRFWCVKLLGILLGLALIPAIYYTYTGILGISADWFNIAIFFIAAGVAFWSETQLLINAYTCRLSSNVAFFIICLIGVFFTVFTFLTPQIPFFQDPVTDTYGFQQ